MRLLENILILWSRYALTQIFEDQKDLRTEKRNNNLLLYIGMYLCLKPITK